MERTNAIPTSLTTDMLVIGLCHRYVPKYFNLKGALNLVTQAFKPNQPLNMLNKR